MLFSIRFLRQIYHRREFHSFNENGWKLGVLGVNLAKGQRKSGVEKGADAIRSTNVIKSIENLGYTVTDYGNINEFNEQLSIVNKIRNPNAIGNTCKKVSEKVEEILQNNGKILTLGGDHSLAIGTVNGHIKINPNLCIIWIDAHSDINTSFTTNSGNMHGMVNSFHLHELIKYRINLPAFDWIKPSFTRKDIVYIALRDIEPLEKQILDECGINVFSMAQIDRLGILEVVNRALDHVNPSGKRPIHVSFDIDSYDTNEAPSTGTSVQGGLTLREGLTLAEEIHKTGLITGLDLVELNPSIGSATDREKTLFVAKQTILAFFGHLRSGNLPLKQ